jgi:hypothetical protein
MEAEPLENTVQYQLTREETVAQLWRLMLRPRLIFSMAFVFLCGAGILALDAKRPIWAFGLMIFPVLFLFFYRRMVHKIVGQHPEFLEEQTMSFDVSGIRITNSVVRVQWPWSRVRSVTDSRDFYILRCGTLGSGAIIPKRALSAQQSERLLSYAKRNAA